MTLLTSVGSQPVQRMVQYANDILMPGEPETRNEHQRQSSGIPLTQDVFESLVLEGDRTGVAFPG